MNSWEKDPDELLRRRWQKVFNEFEVQPRPALTRQILGRPVSGKQLKRRLLVSVCIGLFIALTPLAIYRDMVPQQTITRLPVQRKEQISIQGIKALQPATGLLRTSGQTIKPASDNTDRVALRRKDTGFVAEQADRLPVTVTTGKQNAGKQVRDSGLKTADGNVPFVGRKTQDTGSRVAAIRTGIKSGPARHLQTDSVAAEISLTGAAPPLHTGSDSLTTAGFALVIPVVDHPYRMQYINARRLLTLPGIPILTSIADSSAPVVPDAPRKQLRWFAEVLPQSSFQQMHVSQTVPGYLTPAGVPVAFAPATWGYQLHGGFRFGPFETYLVAGHLRSWASYTVHENRYRVEPGSATAYSAVRETYTISENRLLPLIGLGINQDKLLFKGRYQAGFGGQLLYLTASSRTLADLRAKAGRVFCKWNYSWFTGLSVDYGLNHLMSEHKHLAIRPLLVGVVLRIQPKPGQ